MPTNDSVTTIMAGMAQMHAPASQDGHQHATNLGELSDAVEVLRKGFYPNSQAIMESYYLQPVAENNHGGELPKKVKENLRDGFVERPLHGAMHVARVQFWCVVLNNSIKTLFPTHHQRVFDQLLTITTLSEEQIMVLVRYVALFHDSARKAEAQDQWDDDSANNGLDYLVANQIPNDMAVLFSQAAALKDKKEDYADFLQAKGYDAETISSFQYIRQLVYMADCLDIIRCVSKFYLTRIIKVFKDFEGFDLKTHKQFLVDLSTNIARIIQSQHDMLYPCAIDIDRQSVYEVDYSFSDHSLADKVQLEHAENACAAVLHSIKSAYFFASRLPDENCPALTQSVIEPAFNPYIHGTSSQLLPLLPMTDFSLCASSYMIRTFGVAPMVGELDDPRMYQGGIDTADAPEIVCLGRLAANGGLEEYGLPRIVESYTQYPVIDQDSTQLNIDHYRQGLIEGGFESINKLLLHLARAHQVSIEEDYLKEVYGETRAHLNAAIQLNYAMSLLCTHIHPNREHYNTVKQSLMEAVVDCKALQDQYAKTKEEYRTINVNLANTLTPEIYLRDEKERATEPLKQTFKDHFDFATMVKRIKEQGYDFKTCCENPTNENLQQALSFFNLAKSDLIDEDPTSFFSLNKSDYSYSTSDYGWAKLDRCCRNARYDKLSSFIISAFEKGVSRSSVVSLPKLLTERIKVLEKKLAALYRIEKSSKTPFAVSEEDDANFMQTSFPIILVYESEEKIRLFNFATQEYRSPNPLKIGEEIRMMATDTEKHQKLIEAFLVQHKISHIDVVLISQLHNSLITCNRPHRLLNQTTVDSVQAAKPSLPPVVTQDLTGSSEPSIDSQKTPSVKKPEVLEPSLPPIAAQAPIGQVSMAAVAKANDLKPGNNGQLATAENSLEEDTDRMIQACQNFMATAKANQQSLPNMERYRNMEDCMHALIATPGGLAKTWIIAQSQKDFLNKHSYKGASGFFSRIMGGPTRTYKTVLRVLAQHIHNDEVTMETVAGISSVHNMTQDDVAAISAIKTELRVFDLGGAIPDVNTRGLGV